MPLELLRVVQVGLPHLIDDSAILFYSSKSGNKFILYFLKIFKKINNKTFILLLDLMYNMDNNFSFMKNQGGIL
jgi:hypothetical protein